MLSNIADDEEVKTAESKKEGEQEKRPRLLLVPEFNNHPTPGVAKPVVPETKPQLTKESVKTNDATGCVKTFAKL